jgi:hypothetical protein
MYTVNLPAPLHIHPSCVVRISMQFSLLASVSSNILVSLRHDHMEKPSDRIVGPTYRSDSIERGIKTLPRDSESLKVAAKAQVPAPATIEMTTSGHNDPRSYDPRFTRKRWCDRLNGRIHVPRVGSDRNPQPHHGTRPDRATVARRKRVYKPPWTRVFSLSSSPLDHLPPSSLLHSPQPRRRLSFDFPSLTQRAPVVVYWSPCEAGTRSPSLHSDGVEGYLVLRVLSHVGSAPRWTGVSTLRSRIT